MDEETQEQLEKMLRSGAQLSAVMNHRLFGSLIEQTVEEAAKRAMPRMVGHIAGMPVHVSEHLPDDEVYIVKRQPLFDLRPYPIGSTTETRPDPDLPDLYNFLRGFDSLFGPTFPDHGPWPPKMVPFNPAEHIRPAIGWLVLAVILVLFMLLILIQNGM